MRHYHFCIKKCGKDDCEICRPVRQPQEVFQNVHMLPDSVPVEDVVVKKRAGEEV